MHKDVAAGLARVVALDEVALIVWGIIVVIITL